MLKCSAWTTKGSSGFWTMQPILGTPGFPEGVSFRINRALTVHTSQLQKYFLYEKRTVFVSLHVHALCTHIHLDFKSQGAQLHQSFYLTSVQISSLMLINLYNTSISLFICVNAYLDAIQMWILRSVSAFPDSTYCAHLRAGTAPGVFWQSKSCHSSWSPTLY